MSLAASFYSALSGLDTNSTAMQVIGDNIANLNTSGFKSSSAQFEDVLGQSLSTVSGTQRMGVGAKIASVDGNFTQGTLNTTNVGTDVAANGKGFFVLRDQVSNEKNYTRAGHFYVDNTGYYVNNQGMRVQGYLYDDTGTSLVETLADIRVDQSSMVAPKVTSAAEMALNLDSSDSNTTFQISNPGGTSSYSTAQTIYDTLGASHTITTYFSKTAAQTWQWDATIDGSDISGGTPGTPALFGSGTLVFDGTSGALTTTMPVTFYTGSGPTAITFADGIAASPVTVDFTGTTQYGAPSTIQTLNQDGYAAGLLSGVSVNSDGAIVGSYTNGQVKNIALLVLADFPNLNGLVRAGSALYKSSPNSGEPLDNKPGVGGMGTISSGMLEESNTDLAAEFVKMIITQRAYQANSKIITTVDDMMAQLLNTK
jgi:flagellar hook protein FlgE